jgi:hypothetical protein
MSATMNPGGGMRPMLTPQMASAARNLAAMGSGRDNMLAHINPREARMLMAMGGKGNMNPRTGLPQFDDGSSGGGGTPAPDTEGSATANAAAPTLTPTGQFPAGQTWASLTAADPGSGGVAGLWQDPNSQQWYNSSGALAPLDPTQASALDTWFTNAGPEGSWDPIDTSFAGGGFIPQPGNANFTLNPATGDYEVSPTGDVNLTNQYNAEYAASVENQKRSEAGGLLPLEILGGIGGLVGGVAGLGALGAFGGAAGAAADATGDITAASLDAAAAADATGDVTAAALGPAGTAAAEGAGASDLSLLAADAPSIGSGAATTTAADLGLTGSDAGIVSGDVTGAVTADAGSSLASLGANPTLGQLAAATPDSLLGDAGDATVDTGTAATGGDLTTLDTSQFPGGYIVPPDPTTGLTPGEVAATSAAGGGPVAGGNPGFFDNLFSGNIGGAIGNVGTGLEQFGSKLLTTGEAELSDPFKLLGLGAAGYGLLHTLSQGQSAVTNPTANETQLQGLANQAEATGTQLSSYLTSGTLPPGLMQQVNQATAAAIQAVKAKYAANGMGPNSTAEQQDINTINQNVPATIATIGQQLLSSGTAQLSIAQGTLNTLLTANTSLNNQTNQAIANLARALSGGGGGNTQYTLTPTNTNTTSTTAA